MKCEQFITRMSELIASSPHIERYLTYDDMQYLMHIGDKTTEERIFKTVLNVHYGAVSYVKPITDGFGRKGVWNHTIILNLIEYFQWAQPTEQLNQYFIKESTPTVILNTLELKENVEPTPKIRT